MDGAAPAEFYAMRWPECLAIATKLDWTNTNSWAKLHYYVQTKASARARSALMSYRMNRGTWRRLIG